MIRQLLGKSPSFDPSAYVSSIREYILSSLEAGRKKRTTEPEVQPGSQIQISFGDQTDQGETLLRMIQNATTPEAKEELTQKYLEWEKEKAIRSSFSKRVLDWLERKNMRPAEFYKSAGIEKRTFSKMKNDYLYQPSRDTALRCCFGLRLKCPDALALLRLAGFALNPSDSRDLALRFCLENELYDVDSVNNLLEMLGEEPF